MLLLFCFVLIYPGLYPPHSLITRLVIEISSTVFKGSIILSFPLSPFFLFFFLSPFLRTSLLDLFHSSQPIAFTASHYSGQSHSFLGSMPTFFLVHTSIASSSNYPRKVAQEGNMLGLPSLSLLLFILTFLMVSKPYFLPLCSVAK